jgi:hypothetical protein
MTIFFGLDSVRVMLHKYNDVFGTDSRLLMTIFLDWIVYV